MSRRCRPALAARAWPALRDRPPCFAARRGAEPSAPSSLPWAWSPRSTPRLSVVTVGELLGGFARGSRNRDNRDELRAFLRSRRVSVVPVLDATAERYAVIWAALGVAGQPIPTNDMWIAAAAMEHGAELLTLDGDFEHVPQILVRRFTPYDAGRP